MNLIRHAVMRLMRNRVMTRTLPNGRRLLVSPDAQLKYLGRGFDEDLVALAASIAPGSVVWDVGANCGVFAFSCDPTCDVLAIEADPFLADPLAKIGVGFQRPGLGKSRCIAAGNGRILHRRQRPGQQSSSERLGPFDVRRRARADQRGRHHPRRPARDRAGPVVRQDRCRGRRGGSAVGRARLLSEVRPTLYLEIGEDTRDACEAILRGHGSIWEKGAEMNWLCTPAEPPSTAK